MGFGKPSVPTRRSSARRKGLVGRRRGSEKNVIVPMHIQGEEFEFTEEEVARESHTIKGLVSHTRARNESAAGGLGKRRPFSDVRLSSSNFPNLKFTQRLLNRLSNRTNAFSKWKAPVESAEGSNEKEIFLNRVPAVQRSKPLRSKPCCLTVPSTSTLPAPPPGIESTA